MKSSFFQGPALILSIFMGFFALSTSIASSSTEKTPTKTEIAINAYSLLYDLLLNEKDVAKVLTISKERKAIDPLIREISVTADESLQILDHSQKKEPALTFNSAHLPVGEKATRDEISKTKMKNLVANSGEQFSIILLLTQTEALSYASHLAYVAANNDENSERSKETLKISKKMESLYDRTVALLAIKKQIS
ncbi:MAG: hypothetical protein V4507_06615 [Verrucomicrobiota bacterium]